MYRCAKKYTDYFCIGCYAEYITIYNAKVLQQLWCWGLGYIWTQTPIQGGMNVHADAGFRCFAGLCCIGCGSEASGYYAHYTSKDIRANIDIHTPCGYCKRSNDFNQINIEVKTLCCGCERYYEVKQDENSGAAKTSVVAPYPQPQEANSS
jgi:hypothetical protein